MVQVVKERIKLLRLRVSAHVLQSLEELEPENVAKP